jgi:hypothetical protein
MGYPKLAHHRFPPNGTGSPGSVPLSGASFMIAAFGLNTSSSPRNIRRRIEAWLFQRLVAVAVRAPGPHALNPAPIASAAAAVLLPSKTKMQTLLRSAYFIFRWRYRPLTLLWRGLAFTDDEAVLTAVFGLASHIKPVLRQGHKYGGDIKKKN